MGVDEDSRPRLANRVRVVMEEPLRGAPRKLCMRRISIRQEGDKLLGSTRTHQGSGNIHSMVAHNGLSLLPPDSDCEEGDTIEVRGDHVLKNEYGRLTTLYHHMNNLSEAPTNATQAVAKEEINNV